MAERHLRSRLKTMESAMSAGLETIARNIIETSAALKHRREAAACGAFAVNAKSATVIANAAAADDSGRCSRARATTKTGLMWLPPRPHRRDAIRFFALPGTFPTVYVPRRRAFFGGPATWRNISRHWTWMDLTTAPLPSCFRHAAEREAGRWLYRRAAGRPRKRSALRSRSRRPRIICSARISKPRKQDLTATEFAGCTIARTIRWRDATRPPMSAPPARPWTDSGSQPRATRHSPPQPANGVRHGSGIKHRGDLKHGSGLETWEPLLAASGKHAGHVAELPKSEPLLADDYPARRALLGATTAQLEASFFVTGRAH